MSVRFSPSAAFAAVVLLCLMLPLAGCSTIIESKPVRSTKKFYFTHINAPVEVSLENPTNLPEADSLLVSRLIPVDTQLTSLERVLSSLGTKIDASTAEDLLRRFPWLSSVVLINPEGEIVASMPQVTMKQLDYAPLLQTPQRGAARDLRLHIQNTDLGPEVTLARPFYNAAELQVIMAVSFDFSALISYASEPQTLMVRSVDLPLWTGSQYGEGALAGLNWAEELRQRSFGSEAGYSWLTRYIGYVPLIFATPGQ